MLLGIALLLTKTHNSIELYEQGYTVLKNVLSKIKAANCAEAMICAIKPLTNQLDRGYENLGWLGARQIQIPFSKHSMNEAPIGQISNRVNIMTE